MKDWGDLPKDRGIFLFRIKMYFFTDQEYFGGFIDIFTEIQQVISISQIPAKPEKQSQGEMFQVLQGASFRSVLVS